jgi:GntR family transcriptional regulator
MAEQTTVFTFNPADSQPTYRQLSGFIRSQIENGSWGPGQGIPTEQEFCQTYAISRTTVRLAFKELKDQGLIVQRRGLGGFVAEPKMRRTLNNVYNFSDDMIKAGKTPSSRILAQGIEEAGTEAAKNSLYTNAIACFSFAGFGSRTQRQCS